MSLQSSLPLSHLVPLWGEKGGLLISILVAIFKGLSGLAGLSSCLSLSLALAVMGSAREAFCCWTQLVFHIVRFHGSIAGGNAFSAIQGNPVTSGLN